MLIGLYLFTRKTADEISACLVGSERCIRDMSGFDRLCEADQDFIVSVYGLGIAGLLLRWIGTNMLAPPEPLIRQLYRLTDGSLEGIVQRFLATADDKADR